MAFPSVIASLNDPQASDRLNSPSHSALHQSENTEIEAIETFIGTTVSSAVGTLLYDIRSPDSNGGGHVQSANKGGTGQTSYNKGDMLAASSSSVLAKLAAGLDGQVLSADSSVASGVKWANTTSNKVAVSASVIVYGVSTVTEQSILSVTIPGSTLGTNNAVRATMYISEFNKGTSSSVLLWATYGGARVASVMLTDQPGGVLPTGTVEYTLLANQNIALQRGQFSIDVNTPRISFHQGASSVTGVKVLDTGTSSVQSNANQTIGITSRFSDSNSSNKITVTGYTVEKIV